MTEVFFMSWQHYFYPPSTYMIHPPLIVRGKSVNCFLKVQGAVLCSGIFKAIKTF